MNIRPFFVVHLRTCARMTQNKKFTKTCSKCGAAKPQDAYRQDAMEGSEADKDQVRGMFSESMDSESWCLHRTLQTTDCNFFCRWGSSLANTHCGGSQVLSGWGALRRLAVWMLEKLPGHEGPHWRQAMVGDVSASLRLWVQHWCSADWSTARIIFFLGGGRTFFVYITKSNQSGTQATTHGGGS